MSIEINAYGTAAQSFKIGQSTIYPSLTDPSGSFTINDGDLWLDLTNGKVKIRVSSNWDDLKFDELNVGDSSLTLSGSNLTIGSAGTVSITGTGVLTYNGSEVLTSASSTSGDTIKDFVGEMVTGNTEAGISVTYNNTSKVLNFDVNDPTITLAGEVAGSATMTNLGNTTINVALNNEAVQDVVGGMVTGNAENGIAVTYNDTLGKLDFDTNDFDITLTGDVTGTATVTNLGNVSIATTAAANSVELGANTTGDYIAALSAGAGISVSGSGENATWTVTNTDLGSSQNIFKTIEVQGEATLTAASNTDSFTFIPGNNVTILSNATTNEITIGLAGGTGSNLDADRLDGEHGTYYLNWNNFTNVPSDFTPNTEAVQDIVGGMVSGNTESGIAVTYNDTSGVLNFDVNDPTITLTGDVSGSAIMTNLSNVSISTTLIASSVKDVVGTMVTGNTENGINVTYNSTSKVFDFDVDDFDITLTGPVTGSGTVTNLGNVSIATSTNGLVDTTTAQNVGGNKTFTNDVIVQGNLTVSGTTTTVNTQTVLIADNIITLNSDFSGSPTEDAGIEVERGTANNVSLFWDEANDEWAVTLPDTNTYPLLTSATINENVEDIVGAMVTGNTELGIAVTYDDGSGKLNFDVDNFNIALAGDVTGSANVTNLSNTSITATLNPEAVQDVVGGMVTGNTENGIAVTYNDTSGKLDFDTNDFDITLTGDVTGTATVTNLGNVSIAATVANDSHTHDTQYLPLTGGTMTGNITMTNGRISGLNDIEFLDPGANEGIKWSGGNDWRIYESPDDLTTNGAGNLQFVQNGNIRRFTIKADGTAEIGGARVLTVNDLGGGSGSNADLLDGQHGSYYEDIDSRLGYKPAESATNDQKTLRRFDTRTINDDPDDFNMGMKLDFKSNTTVGLPTTETYSSVVTHRPWSAGTDHSGGPVQQIAYHGSGEVYIRQGTGTTWNTWKKFAVQDDNLTTQLTGVNSRNLHQTANPVLDLRQGSGNTHYNTIRFVNDNNGPVAYISARLNDNNTAGTSSGQLRFAVQENGTTHNSFAVTTAGDVVLNNNYRLRIGGNGDTAVGSIYNNGGDFRFEADTSRDVNIGSAVHSQAIVVDGASGRVGIGGGSATTPAAELELNGTLLFSDAGHGIINNANNVRINIDSNNNGTTAYFAVGHNQTTLDGSNELFRVQENGNFGIGLNSPEVKFHVSQPKTFVSGSQGGIAKFENTTTGQPAAVLFEAVADNGGTGNHGAIWFDAGASGTTSDNRLVLSAQVQDSLAEPLVIRGNGYVGVGTNSPATPLDVNRSGMNGAGLATVMRVQSDAKTAGDAVLLDFTAHDSADNNNQYAGIAAYVVDPTSGSEDGALAFRTVNNGTANERVRIDSVGKVGIGTNNPQAKLTVLGASAIAPYGDAIARFSNTGTYDGIYITDESANFTNGGIGIVPDTNPGSGTAQFFTHFKDATATGTTKHNVKIDGDLEVLGTVTGTFATNQIVNGNSNVDIPSANGAILFDTNGTERMRINTAGNVGIDHTSPNYKLHVSHTAGTYGAAGVVSEREDSGDNVAFGLYNTIQKWDLCNITSTTPDQFILRDATNNTNPFIVQAGAPNNSLIVNSSGHTTIAGRLATGGEFSPDVDIGGICVNHGAGDGFALSFKNSDVAHPFTSIAEADTYGAIRKLSGTGGGMHFRGFGETTNAGLSFYGYRQTLATGDTTDGSITFRAYKSSGTTSTAPAGSEVSYSFKNGANQGVAFKGNGDIRTVGGLATGGETDPEVSTGGICVNTGANDGNVMTFKNSDVAHGMTSVIQTDTFLRIRKTSNTLGGAQLQGFGETSYGMQLRGSGATATTSDTGNGAVLLDGNKKSSTTTTALADGEVILSVRNDFTTKLVVKGNGDLVTQGDLIAVGDVTAFASDARLKENIELIENPLDKLHAISGVTYNFTDEAEKLAGLDASEARVGVLAQQVQEVQPEAVKPAPFDRGENGESKTGEDYLTVQYEKLVPLLIESVKELSNKVDEQAAYIKELEKKMKR